MDDSAKVSNTDLSSHELRRQFSSSQAAIFSFMRAKPTRSFLKSCGAGQVASMKTFAIAVVEQDPASSRVPYRRELHSPRTVQGEVQATRFVLSHENSFDKPERSGQKLYSVTDRLLHEIT